MLLVPWLIKVQCNSGWGYSLWTNRRVVSASRDRVVLVTIPSDHTVSEGIS